MYTTLTITFANQLFN